MDEDAVGCNGDGMKKFLGGGDWSSLYGEPMSDGRGEEVKAEEARGDVRAGDSVGEPKIASH